ncbi:MAG: hypothetical protein M1836_004743 [Candelina mexicana]|nr:MAG: hypothetical protein M1836_004743 [Candelina mexicana]
MVSLIGFVKDKWNPPAIPTDDFSEQTIIVTGANVGLGYEAALKFVSMGAATVILAVRSLNKGNAAKARIEEDTKRQKVVQVWLLDMDSYASVKAFAQRVDKELDRVDAAVLNAGLVMRNFKLSPEGWEETLQVNVLSTALLGILLLPKLKASKKDMRTPRLVIVGSGNHASVDLGKKKTATNILQAFNISENYDTSRMYNTSKLFAMYAANELAERTLDADGAPQVIVLSCCPGACRSELARPFDGTFERVGLNAFYGLFARTTEEGSRTYVSAVLQGKEAHGKYWKNDQITTPGPLISTDEGKAIQKRVWGEIVQELDKEVPRVTEIVQ